MAERRLKLPPFIDHVLAFLGKNAENVVDGLASWFYQFVAASPAFKDLDEREKKALAYALVGDLIVSPIPSPLDTPLDVVVQNRIRQYLPEMDKYRRMAAKVAEAFPYLELLPNYVLSVIATIREKEIPSKPVTSVTETTKKFERLKIV